MIIGLNLSDHFANQVVKWVHTHCKNPLQMAQTTVILPTKRACLTVKNAFVRLSENHPIMLPKLQALYELDDLEENLPPAISSMERLFLLATLCRKKPNVDSFDKALKIAKSLAELLDDFYEYNINPNHLKNLIEEESLAIHWQESLDFLDIIIDFWPQILNEKGLIDVVDRRNRLIMLLKKKILSSSNDSFYIIGGLDGSSPSVKSLIKETSSKNNVLILLNGLNVCLDEDEEKALTENHYQYSLVNLLKSMGKKPSDIPLLCTAEQPQEALIREAFKPAELTDEWLQSNLTKELVKNVKYIECENMTDEALTIALIMRKVLEIPEKTAALVTSDRTLARCVIAQMKRWGVKLDDSAGTPLDDTPTGIFLLLLAKYGLQKNGATALALLKHPLCADGRNPADLRAYVRETEKTIREKKEQFQIVLQTPMADFFELFQSQKPVSFYQILTTHLNLAEKLATSADRSGKERLWQSDDGEEAYQFLTELKEKADLIPDILPELYLQILGFLMQFISFRPKYGTHPRLDILGPIEARLSHPDVCIIGGLNEGTFPTLPDSGPWLNRLMRRKIGLPSPENIFATQSMDFASCFCASQVYLTRSLKTDGSQTIPSRFISRIEAVLEAHHTCNDMSDPISLKSELEVLPQQVDMPKKFENIIRPMPCPPKEIRPKKLPVTQIKNLLTNPYAVYARYILQLRPLNELESFDMKSGYGTALHAAFQELVSENDLTVQKAVQKITDHLVAAGCNQTDLAYNKTKIEKSAAFFVQTQTRMKSKIKKTITETSGAYSFPLCDGTLFTLTAIADRIDKMNDGSYEIIDYKTGSLPTAISIQRGINSQLPLEGLILKQNGFQDYSDNPDKINFSYWHITGKDTGGEIKEINEKTDQDFIQEAKEGVQKLINAYQNDTRPYEAHLMEKVITYDDYEHLARVKEWLSEESEEE